MYDGTRAWRKQFRFPTFEPQVPLPRNGFALDLGKPGRSFLGERESRCSPGPCRRSAGE